MTPDVSLIVPVYNVEKYVPQCLESIAAQVGASFEAIIVDDRSTDRSAAICRDFCAGLPNFKFYENKQNGGLSFTRNRGVELATGEFVSFLDSDDYVGPAYLSDMMRVQRESSADVVTTQFTKVYENGRADESQDNCLRDDFKPGSLTEPLTYAEQTLGGYASSIACARLFRRSLLLDNGLTFPVGMIHEDVFFSYKAMLLASVNAKTDTFDYFYRQRSGSLGGTASNRHLESVIAQISDTNEFLKAHGAPDLLFALAARRTTILARGTWGRVGHASAEAYGQFIASMASHTSEVREAIAAVERSALGRTEVHSLTTTMADNIDVAKGATHADIIFFPHKDYHVWTIALLRSALDASGLTYALVDLTDFYRSEGVREKAQEYGLPLVRFDTATVPAMSPRMLVAFNDWEPIVRATFTAAFQAGIPTTSIVEGIQDYEDADTGRTREPYRASETVIVPGPHDLKYFRNRRQKAIAGGVPRISDLFSKGGQARAKTGKILINSNFSYGVLEDARDGWLRDAVNVVREAGLQPVISKHPADRGALFPELVTNQNFYDALEECDLTIQRFASGILEALARGKPVIYFNPHGERADKFHSSNAFLTANSALDLWDALSRPDEWWPGSEVAFDYLDAHCNLSHPDVAKVICDPIVAGTKKVNRRMIEYLAFKEGLELADRMTSQFKSTAILQRAFPAIFGFRNLSKDEVKAASKRLASEYSI